MNNQFPQPGEFYEYNDGFPVAFHTNCPPIGQGDVLTTKIIDGQEFMILDTHPLHAGYVHTWLKVIFLVSGEVTCFFLGPNTLPFLKKINFSDATAAPTK